MAISYLKNLMRLKINTQHSINGRGLIAAVIFRDLSQKPLVDLTNKFDNCLKNKLLVVKTGRESLK